MLLPISKTYTPNMYIDRYNGTYYAEFTKLFTKK